MWPSAVHAGGINIAWWGIYVLLAMFLASFVIWKKLRVEYTNDEIFTLTLYLLVAVIAGGLGGGIIEWGKFGAISGWGMVLTVISCLWQWCKRNKWDFWELTDMFTMISLWMWFFGSIFWGPAAKWDGVFAIISIVAASIVKSNYRRSKWYKSGKPGLVFLSGLVLYSLAQISVALIVQPKVYWWGLTTGQWVSAWVLAFSLVIIYTRGGRKLKEDLNWNFKKKI